MIIKIRKVVSYFVSVIFVKCSSRNLHSLARTHKEIEKTFPMLKKDNIHSYSKEREMGILQKVEENAKTKDIIKPGEFWKTIAQ